MDPITLITTIESVVRRRRRGTTMNFLLDAIARWKARFSPVVEPEDFVKTFGEPLPRDAYESRSAYSMARQIRKQRLARFDSIAIHPDATPEDVLNSGNEYFSRGMGPVHYYKGKGGLYWAFLPQADIGRDFIMDGLTVAKYPMSVVAAWQVHKLRMGEDVPNIIPGVR